MPPQNMDNQDMGPKNMDQPHPNEPVLEAILQNADENAKSQEKILEHILQNQDEKLSEISDTLEHSVSIAGNKPEVQKVKIITDESELADNFFRMLRGQKGENGDKGEQGEKGDTGADSTVPGPIGERGERGEKGDQGISGKDGKDGKSGKDGKNGRDGIDGKDGKQGPKGDTGKDGKSLSKKDIEEIGKNLKKNESNLLWVNNGAVKLITAGSGVTITGDPQTPTISAAGGGTGTVDTIVAGTGISVNSTDPVNPIVTNTFPDQVVSIAAGTNIASVTGTYPNFTVNAVTQSTGTNTGNQTITSSSDATSHTVTLSASGGSVKFVEGANITLTTSGTGADGIVTIASTGGASGIASINTDATSAQTLTTGTTGTDFAIVDNAAGDHKFNLPVASGTNIGKLSNTDWTTFNNKENAGIDLRLDQTTPQTVINGFPSFAAGIGLTEQVLTPTAGANQLVVHTMDYQGITVLQAVDNTGFMYELGEDTYFIGRNTTASQINKGQVVYVNGATGVTPNLALAKADSITTINVAGVAAENIAINGFGRIFITGIIENIDTNAFTVGDILYVSPTTAGGFTATNPTIPNYSKKIGEVVVKGIGNGKILIRVAATFGTETGTNNSFASAGTLTGTQLISNIATGTAPLVVTSTTPVTNLSIGGNAATVTTNANLTGVITSSGNATSIASQTGTGSKFVVDTSPTLVTPLLGTPTSGTLTNCTGLPIAGLTASTSTAIGVGSIELGHASDTTIARVSAGIISVEGVTVDTISATNTLTNKRVTPRILSHTSYTTDTGTDLNCDNLDQLIVTAQAGALKLNNPGGTPTDGQKLIVAVTGTAARALTYDTQFEASTVALPTTTVTTARLNMGFIWRADTSKWVIIAVA